MWPFKKNEVRGVNPPVMRLLHSIKIKVTDNSGIWSVPVVAPRKNYQRMILALYSSDDKLIVQLQGQSYIRPLNIEWVRQYYPELFD